ncbi:hypothetical protein CSB09_03250 [Candidatus Gracilibacteria bacterium]|nr:MAG: hypothetical protein CSB09_03250 [Candidatus Gracilibacteria bacterium]
MFPFYPNRYISHALIVLSVIITLMGSIIPGFFSHFAYVGAGWHFLPIFTMVSQVILFQFLHGGILHLLLNSYFLYILGPEIEARMSRKYFISFFLFSTVVVVGGLTVFAPGQPTVGISGFCMALLAYLWIDLRSINHPLMGQIGILLFLNIAIGFMPGLNISLFGHLFGAIAGVAWWYIRKFVT